MAAYGASAGAADPGSPPEPSFPIGIEVHFETEPPTQPSFAVIVHRDVNQETLTAEALKAIALGRLRTWSPNTPIQLILEPRGSATRRVWVDSIAGMAPAQFVQHWIGSTFYERAGWGPRGVWDSAASVQLVEQLPGAIAVIPLDEVTDTVRIVPLVAEEGTALRALLR